VATLSGTPVAGATVTAGELRATTDAAGRFEFQRSRAPESPLFVRVEAAGYVTRETRVSHPRSRTLQIDVIREAMPFQLAFYRAFARDGEEEPDDLLALYPWTRSAVFYMVTVDNTGRQVEPEVLDVMRRELPAAFRAWTDGALNAVVEEGVTERPQEAGLVPVRFTRSSEGSCAFAGIQGNDWYLVFNVDRCGCGSVKIDPETVWHEVGHVAGFCHVTGRFIMTPLWAWTCNARPQLSDAEQYHARIVYQRAPGNMDPDRDSDSFSMLQPDQSVRRAVVCAR
jgi:hypothetical protein